MNTMMNPTEIADALDEIGRAPFDAAEFGFAFAEATDNARATISKLRTSTNKSDLPGGVLLNRKFHYVPATPGRVNEALDALRVSKKTASARPAILITTDGETIAAEHPKSGETRHFLFTELGLNFGFLLPAAGKDRYKPAEENPVDVKAAGKLAKLYDTLMRVNPEWATDERRHDMNLFMTRLIFCLFSEDVGVFKENQFSHAVFTYGGNRGEHAQSTIISAFTAMNLPSDQRTELPSWVTDFEYVNGGLFAGSIDVPQFDQLAFRYLREASDLKWNLINPDIFGSMIQSISDPTSRSELGMHYTSVPNIMKVLGPLFLDELDEAIEKAWNRPAALRAQLSRLSRMRIFDPACGSGNFLVVAYRELRDREIRLLQRVGELVEEPSIQMFSVVNLNQFYGIEITDFAAETAKLALFIAEYQANARFADVFGRMPALLPLRDGGNIVHGNALQLNWEKVCPPPRDGEEVFIAGNPPFLGTTYRKPEQRADFANVFENKIESYGRLDFSAAWMFLASKYISNIGARSALITTSSTVQGSAVEPLWSPIFKNGARIFFAYRPFKWANNAAKNAAVECVIVGLTSEKSNVARLFDDKHIVHTSYINAYLIDSPAIFISSCRDAIFSLPQMGPGNFPYDFGHLILSASEKDEIITSYPNAKRFVRKFAGSKEVIHSIPRYCLWISDDDLNEALEIIPIADRIASVAQDRSKSSDAGTRRLAARPHQFREHKASEHHSILVPRTSSEHRDYLPVEYADAKIISSDNNHVIFDGPDWCIALIASRLHLVWIATVCGRLESRFRYSNTLGWNTFPVPKFSAEQLEQLTASARQILRTRYQHHPKTIADLYDPDKMPNDLRAAHKANDDLLETMYIGRPFRNDTERLEKLFKLYAARVEKKTKGA
ncbi:class I SAM-dependent DNA methyltransferase [Ochrobactrum sp. MH181795]|nr:class I SAM-dependent DNA methyltransferase [Ochrobactrum sp. XJ1]RNL45645.1 class I SAM-dependent DNA methyltransferase [Ochrobactrum sp. MH181795]